MKINVIALAGSLAVIAVSCSKQSEDTLTPASNVCDTTNRHYAADVLPILQKNCYICHGANSNQGSGGIVLEGYENLRVKASAGILIGVITHADGFPAMPFNAPKLSDCEINTIRSWVNNGIQNN